MKAISRSNFWPPTMTLDMGNTDKLANCAEAERLGIKVDPPSINRSDVGLRVDGNTIIYALAALKGVASRREAHHRARSHRKSDGKFGDLATSPPR